MDMNQFIGRRFNLISKSDIRYVGTLHEINPEDSTIALENVVSHGTEGRRGNAAEEIAPSTSIYEYIVFRGSDVKDISVADEQKETQPAEPPQMPNDPAILGSSSRAGHPPGIARGPAQQQLPQQNRQPNLGYPQQPPFPGYYPPYGQRFGPPGFPPGSGFPNMPYGAPQRWYPPGAQGYPQPPGQFPPQMPIGPPPPHPPHPLHPSQQQLQPQQHLGPSQPIAPRQTPELPVGEKAASKPATPVPAAEATAARNAQAVPAETRPSAGGLTFAKQLQQKSITTTGPPSAPVASLQTAPPSTLIAKKEATSAAQRAERVVPAIPISTAQVRSVTSTANGPVPSMSGSVGNQGAAQNARTTTNAMQEATRAATAAVAAAMAKLPQPPASKKPGDTAVENVTKQMAEVTPFDGERATRGARHSSRGNRGQHRGGYYGQVKKLEVPETDFDFESANAKFNKQDLVKEAAASSSTPTEPENKEPNGTAATTNGTDVSTNHGGGGANAAYDKTSSFFDNISSESRDREEGLRTRATGREWRGEEQKKNMETFGQGSVDSEYRFGYRGRGRGRGYGGRGRGSYGRGYGGGRGRGFRGARGSSQATGVPASS